MFERTVLCFSAIILMSKTALKLGSSKQGKALRASVAFLFSILFGQLFKNRLMIKNVHSECYLKLSACRVFCEAISIQAFSFVESLQTLIQKSMKLNR